MRVSTTFRLFAAKRHVLGIATALSLAVLNVSAQNVSVGEAEAQKCEERIGAVQRDVLGKYEDALAELQLGFQKTADLEGALAVRTERQRVTAEQTLTEKHFVAEPKALRALQTQTFTKAQELISQLIAETLPKLIELKKQLTVAGKLDEALATRSAVERLQNNHVPLVRPEAGTIVPADSLLVAYGGDRARADKTYKGQRIIVRGVVGGFRPDPADARNFQVFLTGSGSGGWLQCTFQATEHRFREEKASFNTPVLMIASKENEAATVRLQKGTTMDLRGTCDGFEEVVRLSRCDLAR